MLLPKNAILPTNQYPSRIFHTPFVCSGALEPVWFAQFCSETQRPQFTCTGSVAAARSESSHRQTGRASRMQIMMLRISLSARESGLQVCKGTGMPPRTQRGIIGECSRRTILLRELHRRSFAKGFEPTPMVTEYTTPGKDLLISSHMHVDVHKYQYVVPALLPQPSV